MDPDAFNVRLRKYFWVAVVAAEVFYYLFNYGNELVDLVVLNITLIPNSLITIPVLGLVLGFVLIVLDPIGKLERQEFRNQSSWVYYTYWGVFFGILSWIISNGLWLHNSTSLIFGILSLVLMQYTLLYVKGLASGRKFKFTNFAPGSVSYENDDFGYKDVANKLAKKIENLGEYVNVVALYGGYGYGKSSFQRMLLEYMNPGITLHTYISLTETNEAKDFGLLFADRWTETLSERYPKISILKHLPLLRVVLREYGGGLISEFFAWLSELNLSLLRTKSVAKDVHFGVNEDRYVSARVAEMFGNITEFSEKIWVITIDEIDRATPEEIYRVIEVIERFRNEGRSGLPVRLVFLLCIARQELEIRLSNEKCAPNQFVPIIRAFFFEAPKSITLPINLPLPEADAMKRYLVKVLTEKFTTLEYLSYVDELKNVVNLYLARSLDNPTKSYLSRSDALANTCKFLSRKSPRFISRLSESIGFRSGFFKIGIKFRLADLISLEYLQIKYPFVIEFFYKTLLYPLDMVREETLESIERRIEYAHNKHGDISSWIANETGLGRALLPDETFEIESMLSVCAYSYIDYMKGRLNNDNAYQYFKEQSTSYPGYLRDYLRYESIKGVEDVGIFNERLAMVNADAGIEVESKPVGRNDNVFLRNAELLAEGESGGSNLSLLSVSDLLSYARFVSLKDVINNEKRIRLLIIDEIVNRIKAEKIKPKPLEDRDTEMREAIYQIRYQVEKLVSKDLLVSKEKFHIFDSIVQILENENIDTCTKFILISSFVGGTGSRDFELERVFSEIKKTAIENGADVLQAITAVFVEAYKRYFSLDAKGVLYDKEENFFFTLYQYWDGSQESQDMLRMAAQRGLVDRPRALQLYWENYKYSSEWGDGSGKLPTHIEAVVDNFDFSRTQLSLEQLINSTEVAVKNGIKLDEIVESKKFQFWKNISKDTANKKTTDSSIDRSTLRNRLIDAGLLDDTQLDN